MFFRVINHCIKLGEHYMLCCVLCDYVHCVVVATPFCVRCVTNFFAIELCLAAVTL